MVSISPGSRLLIDGQGDVYPAEKWALRARFGVAVHRGGLTEQALRLGCIFISFGRQGVKIALRPEFVTEKAFAQLATFVAAGEPTRIALSHDCNGVAWEVVIGRDAVLDRIVFLIEQAQLPQPRAFIDMQRLPLDACRIIGGGKLLPLLMCWRSRRGGRTL